MADTKTGRERKGRNKTAQLESTLVRRELRTLTERGTPPALDRIDDEFLTDPRDLE
jgi:hypothetical protein